MHTEVTLRGVSQTQAQRLAVFVGDRAAARRAEEPVPPLDEDTRQFTADWNKEVIRVLLRSRVDFTGELDDLPRKPDPSAARPLVPPPDDAVFSAARGAAETLGLLSPDGPAVAEWRTVDAAVSGIVDLMESVIASGGTDRLNARGTALLDDE